MCFLFHLLFITKGFTHNFWRVLSTIADSGTPTNLRFSRLLYTCWYNVLCLSSLILTSFSFSLILLKVFNFGVDEFPRLAKFTYFTFQFCCLDTNVMKFGFKVTNRLLQRTDLLEKDKKLSGREICTSLLAHGRPSLPMYWGGSAFEQSNLVSTVEDFSHSFVPVLLK